ncbi:MAG: flavodoxin family protein [Methanosphaera stadtmanae]|nr:flavodoxin family protein [Methanosphaera stadtmanae]
MLKIIGIVGSPRNDGNTEFMVKTALDEINKHGIETELITLHDKNISYCVGCDKCKSTNQCIINDDMQELTRKVQNADGIIMSSPVYFGDMTGLAKTFIDRLRPLRNIHAFKYKVCGAISTGGFRNGGQETTISSIHDFFLIQGGIIVGDDRPTAHYGGTGVGNTSDDETAITTSINLAHRMIDVTKKINNVLD